MTRQFAFINAEGEAAVGGWSEGSPGNEDIRILVSRDDPALRQTEGRRPLGFAGPTWAPDGSLIALSVIYAASSDQAGAKLIVVDPDDAQSLRVIYEGTPGIGAGIAPGIPHYVNWSPTGDTIALLTQTPAGMALVIVDADAAAPPVTLITGAPMFTAWSASGDHLLIHRGSELFITQADAATDLNILARGVMAFQVPAWAPSGDAFVLVRRAGVGATLQLMDLSGKETALHQFSFGFAALGWSPVASEFLFSPLQSARPVRFRGIWRIALDGRPAAMLTDEAHVAFSWSPDGSQAAYLTPTLSHRRLNWNSHDLRSHEVCRFGRFYPAPEFGLMVSFFEQYALSHRMWSPDSDAFLFNGRILENGTPPEAAPNTLYVQPARPQAYAVPVVKGTQASWRPPGRLDEPGA